MKKPLLSIGIMFKNEIRCLERCMNSLQPLRDAVSCELVMADTGSTDGSREIAEKYADILFDFPWINDFSAARNAVIDRCRGKWYISVDADEWLDEDISEITDFLRSPRKPPGQVCSVVVRNYATDDLRGEYTDFFAARMFQMASGLRYVGRIHEHLSRAAGQDPIVRLEQTLFHHDGYVDLHGERGKPKLERNLALLRPELERDPENLRTLTQYIESCQDENELPALYRRAVALIKAKTESWRSFGPPLLRYAVAGACKLDLPELEEWGAMAEEWFPQSYYTRIDVASIMAFSCSKKDDYEGCIRQSERYRSALDSYYAGREDRSELLFGTLSRAGRSCALEVDCLYAQALRKTGAEEKMWELLEQLDYSGMDTAQIEDYVHTLVGCKARTALERLFQSFSGTPDEKERKTIFLQTASVTFSESYREKEEKSPDFQEHDCQLFQGLACEIGIAARVLAADSPAEMEALLAQVEDWELLPITALETALAKGAAFPPRLLNLEDAIRLAARLGRKDGPLLELALQTEGRELGKNFAGLVWNCGLVLAAMQVCNWQESGNAELCRVFAKVMGSFLPKYYAPEVLCAENIHALPCMHRFGWYSALAFQAKEAGDVVGYVRQLRAALTSCEAVRPIVEFLLEQLEIEERQAQAASELLELAEQIRSTLSAFAPDDPMVLALKQSAAYQQVAHLIEGPDLGVFGGLPQ